MIEKFGENINKKFNKKKSKNDKSILKKPQSDRQIHKSDFSDLNELDKEICHKKTGLDKNKKLNFSEMVDTSLSKI